MIKICDRIKGLHLDILISSISWHCRTVTNNCRIGIYINENLLKQPFNTLSKNTHLNFGNENILNIFFVELINPFLPTVAK